MTKEFFKDFDLPTQHINGNHYIPARTRDANEAERRHGLPAGTVLLEQQHQGIRIIEAILDSIEDPEDLTFVSDIVSAAGINSSWYQFARGEEIMRRRLKLPLLASEDGEWHQDRPGLLELTQCQLASAALVSERLIDNKVNKRSTLRLQTDLGRQIGSVSLSLAAIPVVSDFPYAKPELVQQAARSSALVSLERARTLEGKTGEHPSFAQLADRDSGLSVMWRKEAPNGAYTALDKAFEETTKV